MKMIEVNSADVPSFRQSLDEDKYYFFYYLEEKNYKQIYLGRYIKKADRFNIIFSAQKENGHDLAVSQKIRKYGMNFYDLEHDFTLIFFELTDEEVLMHGIAEEI